ncbi:MAG: DUF4202 domain-containing protein [Gaiellaceae bacterium]
MSALEQRALEWIAPYWNADHLVNTRDWVLELEPRAGEALRLAALTHDMERHFPGGPELDMSRQRPDDEEYNRLHADRSAEIVGDFLRRVGADPVLVDDVELLVRAHEVGGWYEADVLQAADSISWLEVNQDVAQRWVEDGRCDPDWAREKHRWSFERIKLEEARELARPYYEEALASV